MVSLMNYYKAKGPLLAIPEAFHLSLPTTGPSRVPRRNHSAYYSFLGYFLCPHFLTLPHSFIIQMCILKHYSMILFFIYPLCFFFFNL